MSYSNATLQHAGTDGKALGDLNWFPSQLGGAVPPSPTLSGPTTMDTLGVTDTSLVWQEIQGAISYEVQIATDSSFSSVVLDSTVTDTSVVLSHLVDSKLNLATKYYWHVNADNSYGVGPYSVIWSFITPSHVTAITGGSNNLPITYTLSQNYPNPFNPSTVIRYSVPNGQFVTLRVFNILGQEVATLVNGVVSPGQHAVTFNASKFSSGVYIYSLTTRNGVMMTKKMILLK